MATKEINGVEFRKIIKKDGIVVVDFYAKWCGPCRAFAPIYEDVAKAHENIEFLKVDTDAEEALASEFDISSIPTIMVFHDQNVVFKQAGALSRPSLEHLLAVVKQLDFPPAATAPAV